MNATVRVPVQCAHRKSEFSFNNEAILLNVHIGARLHRHLKLVDLFKN